MLTVTQAEAVESSIPEDKVEGQNAQDEKDNDDDDENDEKSDIPAAATSRLRKGSIVAAVTAVGQQRRETLNSMFVPGAWLMVIISSHL